MDKSQLIPIPFLQIQIDEELSDFEDNEEMDEVPGETEINHRLNIFSHHSRSNGPKTVFSGGVSEFETKVSMYTRKPGSPSMNFNEELARNSLIEVGQELQFKASVRSGDGWKFAKLKDLTIQKISKSSKSRSEEEEKKRRGSSRGKEVTPDSAYLVLEDGCRNPIYTAIAPKHPSVDPHNLLVVSFSFRAFMFQDMVDGDTLRISAKIMACQEQVDCQPVSGTAHLLSLKGWKFHWRSTSFDHYQTLESFPTLKTNLHCILILIVIVYL